MREVAEQFEALLGLFSLIPTWAIYLVIAAGAALENIFPPVPSDLMVILGGVLVDRGVVRFAPVLIIAWASNVLLALLVYVAARRYGRDLFSHRWAHWLLRPHQLEQLAAFYSSYGTGAIFLSRFLPVFRVLVPAFAGVSRVGFVRTAIPVAGASAIAYTALLVAGVFASRNVPRLLELIGRVNSGLMVAAVLAFVGVTIWWWRTRRPRVLQRHVALEEERERFIEQATTSDDG